MARSRELRVSIVGDANKLDRELKRSGKALDKLGKDTTLFARASSRGFSGVGLAAKGMGAAVVGGAAGIGFLVKQAMEAEKVVKQTGAVIKSTGGIANVTADDVDKLATAISRKTGVDDEAVAAGQNLLLTFTNIRNEAGKGNDIFDQTTAAAVDMSAAMKNAGKEMSIADAAQQLGKALNDPEKGMTRLAKVGVTFTEQQKRQVKTLVESGRTLDAQRVILRELNKEFGGSAEATAQPLEKLRTEAGNVAESVGRIFKPAIDAGASSITDFLVEAQDGDNILGRLKDAATKAGGELGRIFERKDLDLGEKLKLSVSVLRRNFAPIAREAGRAIEGAKIPAKLGTMFEKAAPRIIDALAASAPRAASAFVRAFRASGTWGKLLTAAFIIGKLGGFSSAGSWAASALARRFKSQMAKNTAFSAAGNAAGDAAASSIGANRGGRFSRAGTRAGRLFGKGLLAGVVLAVPAIANELTNKLTSALGAKKGTPSGAGQALIGKIFGIDINPFGRAAGGIIPGRGDKDTVPAMLTPGEFVIRKQVVEKFGPTFFARLNDGDAPQFKTGGGIISRANKLDRMQIPYLYGGGHGTRDGFNKGGMDCSSSVSYALGVSPRVSGAFMGFGRPGPGSPNDTKIYANPGHMFAVFNGRGWGTSRENPGGGPGWLSYSHRPGFTIRHLEDGGRKGKGTKGDPQEVSEPGKSREVLADKRRERAARAGSRLVNRIAAKFSPGIRSASRGAAAVGGVIEQADAGIGRSERFFGQVIGGQPGKYGEEDLGTAEGRTARISELENLRALQKANLARRRKRLRRLQRAEAGLKKTLKAINKSLTGKKRARGTKAATIRARRKKFEDDLVDVQAEIKDLGGAISDTVLDIGDLTKEIGEVGATPDTEVEAGPEPQSAADFLGSRLSIVDAMERAGDLTPEQARAERQRHIELALGGAFGQLSELETLNLRGDLRELLGQNNQALSDNTAALMEVKASLDATIAYANSVSAITSLEAVRALSDIISGQLGTRVSARGQMPGSGALSRF